MKTQRTLINTKTLIRLCVIAALLVIIAAAMLFYQNEPVHAESLQYSGMYSVRDCTEIKNTPQSVKISYGFSEYGTYKQITEDCTIDASGQENIYFKVNSVGEIGLLYHVTYHSGDLRPLFSPFGYVTTDTGSGGVVIGGYISGEGDYVQNISLTHVDAVYTVKCYTVDYRYIASEQRIEIIDKLASAYMVRIVTDSDLQFGGKDISNTSIAALFSAGNSTYKRNGMNMGAYVSGTALTAEGKYEITNTLVTGRNKTVIGYVDKTAPTLNATSSASKTSVYATYSYSTYESPVTAEYTLTAKNGSVTSPYASGQRLTQEGKYIITATDTAGNSSSTTLYVDKTAPNITRAFEYGTNNGKATFTRAEYESPITATYTLTTSSGTSAAKSYTSGTALTAEGKYTVTVTDAAGNTAQTTFIVDRTSPTPVFADGTSGTSAITRTSSAVSWSAAAYEAPIAASYSFRSVNEQIAPSVTDAPYISGSAVTAEGTYTFTVTDAAGNTAVANAVIDKSPPRIVLASDGKAFNKFTNTAFTAKGDDSLSGVASIELYENGKYIDYDYVPRSDNGEYLFRITDKAGNVTSASAVVYMTDTFGNGAAIRDSYKVNAWYVVTLPARIFTTDSRDVAGRYSFETYESALEFAIAKEREFRVSEVQGGYMYVSASNEAVAQKYDTESAVLDVVEKYARGYISARQTLSPSGNNSYYTEPESLTRNSPILPDYLLDLKDIPRYFALPTAQWSLPKLNYLTGMGYTVTAEYLGDFAAERNAAVSIPSGATLSVALGASYKQGWYLITETDEAGNNETYLIYSDAELPTVRVKATFGNGDRDFVLDYDYTKNETPYFVSLQFEGLLDNIDEYVTLKLEKGMNTWYFTQADALPTLGSDEYTSGKYTVTVYDRSMNALVFDVYIAGNAPTMTHGSLAADKPECKISFVISDRYNVITGITLYKIEHDGTKTVLETDGLGTPINAATLSYTLTVGGKYGATITDNYRRTLELEPVFFLKGLPNGKLSGVSDGGRTNSNVSFTFDSGDVCELFVLLPDGERSPFTDFTVQTGSSDKTYNITASDLTSHEYLVFLHNARDLSLFVEYTFEIDTVLPEFAITDGDGNVISTDGATNKPFSIKWSETGVSVRYYTAKGGALSATQYKMNTVLSQSTLYYFTIKDDVGNTLDFTVLLDNVVDYDIDGKFAQIDGVLYAAAPITFTVNEPTQVFDVANSDGYTIDNGGTLTQEGCYEITVTDNYRNTVTIKIVLDFTPPELNLDGAESGGTVRNAVMASAVNYDYLYLTDSKGNKLKDIASGATFTAPGSYYITVSDYAGNIVTASFTIDLEVDYTLSAPRGGVTTESVTLTSTEPLNISVTLDGESIDATDKFVLPGVYELTLSDAVGNTVSCVFVILPSRVRTIEQALPDGTRIVSIMSGGEKVEFEAADKLCLSVTGVYSITLESGGATYALELTVDNTPPVITLERDGNTVKLAAVDKENIELKAAKDGAEISCSVGKTFSEPGHYVLTVTDELGNETVVEFDIPYRLNTWAIVAIAVGAVALIVVLVLIIRARRKPRMK